MSTPAFRAFSRALRTARSTKSTAVTQYPRRANAMAFVPVPHPISRTVFPGSKPASRTRTNCSLGRPESQGVSPVAYDFSNSLPASGLPLQRQDVDRTADIKVKPFNARRFPRRLYRPAPDAPAHDERPSARRPRGADEGFSCLCDPGAPLPARRRHGGREVLPPGPDRGEQGEGLPPLGPRWERVHRLLPVLRSARLRPRPPARDEGDP